MKKLVLLLIGIFMISSVYALGVTPGRTTIDFEPGLQKNIGLEVINSGAKDISIILSAQGELAEYITLSSETIFIPANQSKTVNYNINFPESLEPGLRTGKVFIMEIPDSSELGSSAVLATLAVVSQLYVNVLYPGKFATSDMIIYNADEDGEATFVFPVVSHGEFDLTSVRANVDIYNSLNEKVDSFNTNSIEVPSGEKKEIIYKWKADVPIGNYRAAATVIYDDGKINLEKTFSVGAKELELQEINVNDFSLGEIVKLEMLIENKWSEIIKDAHIETRIKNEAGDVVSSFDSASYDIESLSKQVFVSYWDTAGVKVGNYDADVSIYYDDKSSKKSLEFQVEENELTIIGLGYVISDSGGESNNLIIILVVVIVLLVLINLLWFFLLRKKLKK